MRSTSDAQGTDMFTQLSLFDSAGSVDTLPSTSGFVHVSAAKRSLAKRPAPARGAVYERRVDELQPMGELARLVLARYDLLASRRRERDRRRREQPRKSIRVLSPPPATVT